MNFLVTGGCGFIGSHIAEALVGSGQRVRIFDDLSSGKKSNIAHFETEVEFIEGDIRDVSLLRQAVQGVDCVFHEAALVSVFDSVKRPEENHEINITGTFNVFKAACDFGVKRVVFASSAAIYGNSPDLPKTENMLPDPESPYALAKITGEYYAAVLSKVYGVEIVCLRYFNVYGPRQDPTSMYSGVISKFTDAIQNEQAPTIFGDGKQTRDFVFVKDVVEANLLASRAKDIGRTAIINVGTGKQTSLLELLQILKETTGKKFDIEFREARIGDVKHSLAHIGPAKSILGFTPKYDLQTGLAELLNSLDGSRAL